MVQIKKNTGKCEILPLALHLARTGYMYIYVDDSGGGWVGGGG